MASRSGDGKPKVRTRSQRSGASTRRRSSEAETKDGDAEKPDIDELRQRRAAYFSRPVAERQKVIRPKISQRVSASPAVSTAGDHERRRKKRSHRSSSSETTKTGQTQPRRRLSTDYVYGASPALQPVEEEPVAVDTTRPIPKEASRHSQERDPARHRTSRRHSSLRALDTEVTPDDSISVVAERRASSGRSRPALKRSSTTPLTLLPVSEGTEAPSIASTRRTSKHHPTLLGTLLRRQSTTAVPTPPRLVECLTCGSDDVPHALSAKLACGHRMCHDCLKRVFDMSVKDPAHMPPRCCTDDHIPLKHVDKLFDLKFKVLWNRKYQEYHTRDRIYCPAPKCGEWIKPSHVHRDSHGRKYAHCPRCKTNVCTLCNNKRHRSRDCPEDPEIAQLVAQAKQEGWQRCFSCSALVELKEGCNHMTCRCLAEFCMVCGGEWKTCDCPWFAYNHLPNPDVLAGMRVPEAIQVVYRRVFDAANPAQQAQPPPEQQAIPHRERTYQEELQHRRRQERDDAALARRLQLASLLEPDDAPARPPPPPPPRARAAPVDETWGLGNAAGHFLNDDFVQNAANVVMSAFGDAALGARGERASGRRRRARMPEPGAGPGAGAGESGLVADLLGDESVLGVQPSRRRGTPA
ncbi:hypothetical protein LTR53_016976 [Teratosphaeriaceae sp. CCFEE 6253]|nr:hypothetical protein LTR53_016976 [Teratosphaeriaceae sp. CCFEE 6253]